MHPPHTHTQKDIKKMTNNQSINKIITLRNE